MRQSTKIIFNSGITYARMAISVGLGLAVTRLALQSLHDVEYGLLTTLGASGALLLVISDALTASTQRHMAYEIGRDDHDALRAVFNTALVLFAGVGLLAAAVGLALWPLLRLIVDIPEGRGGAAAIVYVLTLASIVLTVLATPHRGFLAARQSFWAVAVYDLSQAVLGFVAVLVLFAVEGDRLIAYAWLLLGVRVIAEGLAIALATIAFPDCRPRPRLFRKSEIPRIASFAGWTIVSNISWRLRVQGSTILLNSFYGSTTTAAFGIATQLGGYQNQLGAAVWRVVDPAMSTIEGRGGSEGVRRLAMISSKYLVLLTLFFMVPAELEMEQLLGLWLNRVPPPHTAIFARLVLFSMAMNWASIGFQLAMEAKGKLARYAVLNSVFDAAVIILQLATVVLWPKTDAGRPLIDPWLMPAITIVVMAAQNVWRAWYVGRILNTSLLDWVRQVVLPCAIVFALGAAAAAAPMLFMDDSPWRLLISAVAYGVVAAPVVWFVAMAPWEREHFQRVAAGGFKLARKFASRASPRTPDQDPIADLELPPMASDNATPNPPAAG